VAIIWRPVIAVIACALLLTACEKSSDAEQIAQNIAEMQEAVEEGSFFAIRKHLAENFVANNELDAEEVKRMLQVYSLQHRKIDVTLVDSETQVDETLGYRAESQLSVIVTGSSGLIPSDGSIRRVDVLWEKHGGDWLVMRADWRRNR